jgi:hypothetical protein
MKKKLFSFICVGPPFILPVFLAASTNGKRKKNYAENRFGYALKHLSIYQNVSHASSSLCSVLCKYMMEIEIVSSCFSNTFFFSPVLYDNNKRVKRNYKYDYEA